MPPITVVGPTDPNIKANKRDKITTMGIFKPSVILLVRKFPNFSPYLNIVIKLIIREVIAMPKLTDIPIRETPPLAANSLTTPKVKITTISVRIVAPVITLPSKVFIAFNSLKTASNKPVLELQRMIAKRSLALFEVSGRRKCPTISPNPAGTIIPPKHTRKEDVPTRNNALRSVLRPAVKRSINVPKYDIIFTNGIVLRKSKKSHPVKSKDVTQYHPNYQLSYYRRKP